MFHVVGDYIFNVIFNLKLWRLVSLVIAGVVLFYKDFVEFLYELLGGTASITGK